jgi:glycosyltransferase involved in cell wall biosynthesis
MLKITIITATYNSEATLRDTMDSILRQTWQGYEYIVVDGASTDSTLDIIKEYEPKFEGKMKYISEPDRGIYDAMNKGFAMATGSVIGILNSDDFYTSVDVLQTIAGNFLLGEMDAVYADIHYVKNDDVTKSVRYYSSAIFRRPLMLILRSIAVGLSMRNMADSIRHTALRLILRICFASFTSIASRQSISKKTL